ncbi:MAG: Eco57I restriction-modification methylase domain-containing protein, partial [Winogradskyella sp.]|nr:Eco57I restriction-modification methylase domain-containing protein [Winogradskyella sp.]
NVEVHFINADILNRDSWNLEFKDLQFDIIVSNPPYVRNQEKAEIKNNVLKHEPHLALFVEDHDPLQFYHAISDIAVDKLTENGLLFFEINQYLGNETKQLLHNKGFKDLELKTDIFGNNRMLKGLKNF